MRLLVAPNSARIYRTMALNAFRLGGSRPLSCIAHDLRVLPLLACDSRAAARVRRLGHHGRYFHVAPFLMPPLVFGGLFVALWTWKCMAMIMFQNTIIYNPFLPPNARSMTIAEFAKECGGIGWREERIKSLDGTEIALCVSDVSAPSRGDAKRGPVYILYFQGLSL